MKTYLLALLSLTILLIAHVLAGNNGWYYTIYGYDIFMHILGGLGLSFCAIAFLHYRKLNIRKYYWIAVLLVFVAGFIWELFEAYYGIAGAPVGTKAYYIDTVKDLIDDTIGAIVATFIDKKISK